MKAEDFTICYARDNYSTIFALNTYFNKPNLFINLLTNNVNMVDIGIAQFLDKNININTKYMVQNSLFNVFCQKNSNNSLNDNLLEFTKKLNTKYIILQSKENYIRSILEEHMTLVFSDEISGEKIYKFEI
jgi:hypothetical protein